MNYCDFTITSLGTWQCFNAKFYKEIGPSGYGTVRFYSSDYCVCGTFIEIYIAPDKSLKKFYIIFPRK